MSCNMGRWMGAGMNRKTMLIGVAIVIAVVAIGVLLTQGGSASSNGTPVDEPLEQTLRQVGFDGGIEDWVNSLTDEQAAVIDIAFEAASKDGYKGTKEAWLASEAKTHMDLNGNSIVVLPDGGEFTYILSGDKKQSGTNKTGESQTDAGKDVGKQSGDKADQTEKSDKSKTETNEKSDQKVKRASTPTVTVDSVHAHQGDTRVVVPVMIKSNPGVLGMTLSVSYDEKGLTLVGAENGEAFADVLSMTHSRSYASGCLFTWDGVELTSEGVKDGTILTLYFDVAPDTTGIQSVAARCSSPAFDADLNEVELVIEDGKVIVG